MCCTCAVHDVPVIVTSLPGDLVSIPVPYHALVSVPVPYHALGKYPGCMVWNWDNVVNLQIGIPMPIYKTKHLTYLGNTTVEERCEQHSYMLPW